jgi:alpha-mannosidase
MSDGKEGLSLLSKGLFEYEALENDNNTLLLTILRACRIKLAVSEEKMAELPDPGVQCPGTRSYEYAIAVHAGDWQSAGLLQQAAEYYTPVRIAMTGRGQGNLPLSASLFTINNGNLHVTAVKGAEDGQGLIIRFFNPTDDELSATLTFGKPPQSASLCKMDESFMNEIAVNGNKLKISARRKKIVTVRVAI